MLILSRVILHGVNAIVKGIPYVPTITEWDQDISLTSKDFETLHNLGLNVIRLGVMWPGVEPTRGQYNMTYLNVLKDIVQRAEEYGIYTLLDMHQDVLSEKYCGEGVPYWAANSSGAKEGFPSPETDPFTDEASDGFPTRQDCAKFGWASYYSTYATSAAFESLYTNVDGEMISIAIYDHFLLVFSSVYSPLCIILFFNIQIITVYIYIYILKVFWKLGLDFGRR
jgi:endoglycosylceramidase